MNHPADPVETFLIPLIRSLSNPGYQKRVWLEQEGTVIDSYGECLESFFDVCEIFEDFEKEDRLSHVQARALEELHEMVDTFDDTVGEDDAKDVKKILENPEWKGIQKKAKEVLDLLTQKEV